MGNKIKLELGKTYQTNDAEQVKCIAIWSEPDCYDNQATCLILTGRDQGQCYSFGLDGKAMAGLFPPIKHPWDIIKEVE